MGDYQRQEDDVNNDMNTSTQSKSKGLRSFFKSSPGGSGSNNGRSVSTGRASSNHDRYESFSRREYNPPSTPTSTPLQSNTSPDKFVHSTSVGNIEMPTINNNNIGSPNNVLSQRNHKRGISLDTASDNKFPNIIIDTENPIFQSQISRSNTAGTDISLNTNGSVRKSRIRKSSSKLSKRSTSTNYNKQDTSNDNDKLDTYSGVFLPCLAQIVGVIFFLRLPTITGQAGTIYATLIILCCVFSTFLTSLSLSAIASNGTIQAGGPYYIISRTLGVEIGGALGILFYLGTTLGASMHVMGAIETIVHRKKHSFYQNNTIGIIIQTIDSCPNQIYSLLLMLIISKIVAIGNKYISNATNFFLLTVGLSIVSILVGTILFATSIYDGTLSDDERAFNDNLYPNYRPDPKVRQSSCVQFGSQTLPSIRAFGF